MTRHCLVCGGQVKSDRHKQVQGTTLCSRKCEIILESKYDERNKKLTAKVEATTAWKSLPLDTPLKINASKVGILTDIHAPIHSAHWLKLAIETFHNYGVRHVHINGDLTDFNTISRHKGEYYARNNSVGHDLDATESVLNLIASEFDHVTLCMGNHDQRLLRLFGGEVSVQRIFKIIGSFPNLQITSRSFVVINDDILCIHPRQYSRIRGSLAQKLALRWQKHIITGHQHHSSKTISPCGKFQCVDIGCLADIEAQDYVRNEITDHVEPMQGFGIVSGLNIMNFDKFTPTELFKGI